MAILLAAPARAQQPHASDIDGSYWNSVLPGGQGCYSCHTLDEAEGDPDTSYINSTSGVLSDIRRFNTPAYTTPVNLGCVYCHYRTGQTKMKGILNHFDGKRSQHPVGRTFTGASPYTDTQNEYLSTDGSSTANEMDCLDCHDPNLVIYDYAGSGGSGALDPRYMIHSPTAQNPYMLKDVTTAGQYDAFCRGCHGTDVSVPATFKGKDIRLHSHADGRDDTTNAIKEMDGTLLRPTDPDNDGVANAPADQCTKCHDAHYSANAKLFNDGKQDAAVSSTNCTALCHYPGDRNDNYLTHGHGAPQSTYEYSGVRLPGNKPCVGCHESLDLNTPNSAGTRKAHAEKRAITGAPSQANYKANFNLTIDLLVSDAGTPTGNPAIGICWSCHSLADYKAHYSYENSAIGCQDCHDEHAEGSGAASNVFMIPETTKGTGFYLTPTRTPVAGESVIYDSPRYLTDHVTLANPAGGYDFYAASGGTGACDNTACHGPDRAGGTRPGPLATLMGTSSADTLHSGGYQAPGSDCGVCHKHNDTSGGWGAEGACNDCHTTTDTAINTTGIARTHTDAKESLARHSLHANSTLIVGGCAACHPHDGKTVSPGTGVHMDGTVTFGGAFMTAAVNYGGSAFPDTGCSAANGCHDAQADEWKGGLGTGQNGCVDCHNAGNDGVANKTLDQGGWPNPTKTTPNKHQVHQNSAYVTGDGVLTYQCTDCHGATADAGTHTGHKNGTVEVASSGTNVKVTGYWSADKTCTNLCHAVGQAVVAKRWSDGALVCTDCHAGAYVAGNPAYGSGGQNRLPQSGLHDVTPTVSQKQHGASFTYNGASTADCVTCHSSAPTTTAGHLNGTWDASIGVLDAADPKVNLQANVGFADAATPSCAPSLAGCHSDQATGTAWGRLWHENATQTNGTECAGCHGGAPVQAAPTTWTAWTTNAGTLARTGLAGVGVPDLTGGHGSNWDNDGAAPANEVELYHSACKSCHGMNTQADTAANYNAATMWDPTGVTSDHGNGQITMNGPSALINAGNNAAPLGAEYNGNDDGTPEASDWGCTKACHQGAGNALHNMGDSAWPIQYKDFGAGACDQCHGYPPLPSGVGGTVGNYEHARVEDYAGGGAGHDAPDHVLATAVAADGWTPCLKCHPDTNHGQGGATVSRTNVQVTVSTTYNAKGSTATFTAGASPAAAFCANVSCHGGVTTPMWSGGTINPDTQCTLCHVRENVADRTAATEYNSAITGLHAVTTTVAGKDHWLDAGATCGGATSCHLGQPANHFGANLDSSAMVELTTANANLRAGITVATGPAHDPNADTCAVACHSDAGAWARLNDKAKATALITDTANVCATCHGTFATGWTAGAGILNQPAGIGRSLGNQPHATDWDNNNGEEVTPKHSTCKTCHGMNSPTDRDTDYLAGTTVGAFWDPTNASGFHGNGRIDMNGPSADDNGQGAAAGAEYNGNMDAVSEATDYSCTKACHQGANNLNHNMGDSGGWPVQYRDYGAGSCDGCHQSETTAGGYWPEGGTTPDRGGRHQKHMEALALKLGFSLPGTDAQQKQACAYCHEDPAGANFDSGLQRHQDGTGTVNGYLHPLWQAYALDFATTDANATWATASGGTCTTVDCHNNKATTTVAPTDYTWYGNAVPPGNTTSCIMCHVDITQNVAGTQQTHYRHANANATFGIANIPCASCHGGPPAWGVAPAAGTPPSPNHIDGTLAVTGGAVSFTYSGGSCAANACHNDGTGPTSAPVTTPYTWGTAYGDCTLCHANLPATGAHTTHLGATAYGPHSAGSTDCGECHKANANNTSMAGMASHLNGTVSFLDRLVPATPFEVASGQIGAAGSDTVTTCDNCHGGNAGANAAAGAKDSWATAASLACGTCHGDYALASNLAAGGGISAPDMMGDSASWGSDFTGHTRAGTPYAVSGRPAAGKACDTCHNRAAAHINGVNGSTFADARLLGTINSQAVTSTETACNACHQAGVGGDAGTQVSRHGNDTGGGYVPIEGAMTAVDCGTCHEVHGLVNGGGLTNGWMFRYALTTPFGVRNVQLTASSGTNSFDEDDGETTNAQQLDDACATCHINGSNASTMVRHTTAPAGGGIHENNPDYTGNERGKNCSACHPHDYDSAAGTANGFMPQKCDSCHSFPGLPGPSDHTLSQAHDMHFNALASGGYAFDCTVCHYGYTHNQTNYVKGVTNWTSVTNASINISFDPTRNPGAVTYATQPAVGGASTAPGANGTGACGNLYCHGQNPASQSDWLAHPAPAWSTADPARLNCNACHDDPPASGAHALHVVDNGATDRTDCNYCHTTVGNVDAGPVAAHVNGTTEVLQGYGNQTTAIPPDGYCSTNACHSSGATDGRWNETALNCNACHHYKTGDAVGEHGKHTNGAALQMTCVSCHTLFGDSETPGAALTHPSNDSTGDGNGIFDKYQALEAEVDISDAAYNGGASSWVNGADTCSNAWCHDPSNAGTTADWDAGATIANCSFCHAAVPATGSHDEHFAAQTTYGLAAFAGNSCAPCHAAVVAGNYDHIAEGTGVDGNVEFGGTVITTQYTAPGVLPVNGWGTCGANACHNTGDGVTAPAGYTWNTAVAEPSCAMCHTAPPATGRHAKHDLNTAYVADSCGACHEANANKTSMAGYTTHIDGTVDVGGTATVSYLGGGDCTNDCHNVNPGTDGDWLDANPLACVDCHGGTYLGGGTYAPASGLHVGALTVTGNNHYDGWDVDGADGTATGTCVTCHTSTPTNPAANHVDGTFDASVGADDTVLPEVNLAASVVFVDGVTPTCSPVGTCHGPTANNGDNGTWARRWSTTAQNSDGTECANCHGTFTTGWTWNELAGTTTDHTDPYLSNTGDKMDKHGVCQTCHGWGDPDYSTTWGGTAPSHGDGLISMNGPTPNVGAEYDDATGGCTAACHAPGFVLNTNSGWTVNYGDYGAGNCENCHNGVQTDYPLAPNVMGGGSDPDGSAASGTPKPYDDGTWGFNVSGHGANGTAPTKFDLDPSSGTDYLAPNAACTDCHELQSHHNDGTLDSASTGVLQANTYHLRTDGANPFVPASAPSAYTVQLTLDTACWLRCHSGVRSNMRHSGVADSYPLEAAWFGAGTSGSFVNGPQALHWPIDSDVSTLAPSGAPHFMPCVTCHNVHGANITEPASTSPRMMRSAWKGVNSTPYCTTCHP